MLEELGTASGEGRFTSSFSEGGNMHSSNDRMTIQFKHITIGTYNPEPQLGLNHFLLEFITIK